MAYTPLVWTCGDVSCEALYTCRASRRLVADSHQAHHFVLPIREEQLVTRQATDVGISPGSDEALFRDAANEFRQED